MQNQFPEDEIVVPRSVTILLLFVLSITVWDGLRAWGALADWEILTRFKSNPFYIFATGIIWFILGATLLFLIFKGYRHTLKLGLIASLVYALWCWVDRFVMQATPVQNIPFSIVATIFTLIVFNTILFWPSSQAFFKETQ